MMNSPKIVCSMRLVSSYFREMLTRQGLFFRSADVSCIESEV